MVRASSGVSARLALALACGTAHGAAASSPPSRGVTVHGTVATRGAGSHVPMVVSLESPSLAVAPPVAPVEMDQRGFRFIPLVLPVVSGTTVRFSSADPEPHNVYSPEGRFDLGTWHRGETRDHTFDMPGVYTQLCRIHPDMVAYVVVLPTPYFAVADPAGRFEIHDVAPGRYRLVVWNHALSGVEREVTVAVGQDTRVDLVLEDEATTSARARGTR